ncbi:acetyltransferase (GNAT) family protein [Thioflavicoccus mobilis 8321]|uniref:Acetyltransferase (GNAT) family protein n=1 Tax=Thioflavicoccus mobilis 8321 TaxID=765912 RepID=L0GWM4_9GAMM|nr:GNAT family N-acetyltransferase [Thioflavicoccus mobilis]AGA91158.1 acetyltransferase (GNAT) family protein [Thioflavicoccus mobilis 8321]
MAHELIVRAMTRAELDTLVDWAAAEGWNPGLNDAQIFWDTDPDGFIAAELGGELIGGGSIVAYEGRFGFMGFFIVRPEHRSRGLGRQLWYARRDRLIARLRAPAVIGMDGVFAMQAFYARGGFVLSHRDLRFEGVGVAAALDERLVDLAEVPIAEVARYDAAHFPAPRADFLAAWIAQPGGRALGVVHDGALRGYGVIRRCRRGFKIGPLFAADGEMAEALFRGLADQAAGEPLFLDLPENNPAALALTERHGLREVFGCARMYYGPPPALPDGEIYGVTTFELG